MARRSRVGEFRSQILLQTRVDNEVSTTAGDAGIDIVWTDVAWVAAKVTPIGGQQIIDGRESTFNLTYRIEIRPYKNLTKQWGVLYTPPDADVALRLSIENIRDRDELMGVNRRKLLECRIVADVDAFQNPSPTEFGTIP